MNVSIETKEIELICLESIKSIKICIKLRNMLMKIHNVHLNTVLIDISYEMLNIKINFCVMIRFLFCLAKI